MQGRIITLSLKKINQRSARPKLDRLKRAGINMTFMMTIKFLFH